MKILFRALVVNALLMAPLAALSARAVEPPRTGDDPPLGIALEGWPYPYPVHLFALTAEGQPCRMAYMDVAPTAPVNGRIAVLLHGKNFSSDYWSGVIAVLTAEGTKQAFVGWPTKACSALQPRGAGVRG